MRHQTYVQRIQDGRGGYFASCMTCGSDPFPDRATEVQAELDAKTHGDYRDIYGAAGIASYPVGTMIYPPTP